MKEDEELADLAAARILSSTLLTVISRRTRTSFFCPILHILGNYKFEVSFHQVGFQNAQTFITATNLEKTLRQNLETGTVLINNLHNISKGRFNSLLPSFLLTAVLWIRNDLFRIRSRIRIRLFREFRIRSRILYDTHIHTTIYM